MDDRILYTDDHNIDRIRAAYPSGLHFAVGDTHCEYETLRCLLKKIGFDPKKDHAYFLGDYNAGGDPGELISYMAQYYSAEYSVPGFHMIRGNHERELKPVYALENLPDIIVYRGRVMDYYLVHAGMADAGFRLIRQDMRNTPGQQVFAYALCGKVADRGYPLRQIVWSENGLYSQTSPDHVWPSQSSLYEARACVIHGHTPFCLMKNGRYFSYGGKMLFWSRQKVWFAEDLQSFDIDSNIKGSRSEEEPRRGLSCICLEVLDEIAEQCGGKLTREGIRRAENFVFSASYRRNGAPVPHYDKDRILGARPKMKKIGLNAAGEPYIFE